MCLVLKTIKTFTNVLYILIFLIIFLHKYSHATEIRIGVASNFLMPMNAIKQNFENENKTKIYLSSGSSGSLYSQIINGAPLDIFLSANQDFPKKLENTAKGVKGTRFTYARGKLLLFSTNKDFFDFTFPNIILSEKILPTKFNKVDEKAAHSPAIVIQKQQEEEGEAKECEETFHRTGRRLGRRQKGRKEGRQEGKERRKKERSIEVFINPDSRW